MVTFTCNNCGESLRKPMVEKHYAYSCRSAKSLTCVDCLKDFREEDYVAHTKCLTEEERYAAKGSMPNGVVKKGELKQESWVEMIRSILDKEPNLKQSQRTLLETVSNYDNVPRKKPKFLNFIKSSSGNRVNMRDVEDIWNIIEKYKNNKSLQIGMNGTIEKNNENSTTLEDKSNKRKVDEDKTNEVVEEQPKQKKKKKHSNGTVENNENLEMKDKSNKKTVVEENTSEVVEEQIKPTKKKKKQSTFESEEKLEEPEPIIEKENKRKVDEDETSEVVKEQPKQKKKKKHSNGTVENNENSEIKDTSNKKTVEENTSEVVKEQLKRNKKNKKQSTFESEEKVEEPEPIIEKENKRKVDEDKTNEVVEEQPKQKKKKKHCNGTVENSENSEIKDTSNEKTVVEETTSEIVEEQIKRNKKNKKQSNFESEKKVEEPEPIIEKQDVESPETEKFSFQNKILSVLQSKGTVSLRKLEQKILNAYLQHSGESETSPKISKKFNKKLKKMAELEINHDTVSLKQ